MQKQFLDNECGDARNVRKLNKKFGLSVNDDKRTEMRGCIILLSLNHMAEIV